MTEVLLSGAFIAVAVVAFHAGVMYQVYKTRYRQSMQERWDTFTQQELEAARASAEGRVLILPTLKKEKN